MHILRRLFIAIATLAAFAGASGPAAAAESYDGCLGFIDALPATITTQGVWCLREDLDTSAATGNMIDIQTNNVTIDCNGFRMRGSGGGASTTAVGISASGRLNITIRHCTIRGFSVGIQVTGGSGVIVENNQLDQSRFVGINTGGAGSIVRRNNVVNTVGSPGIGGAYAIFAEGEIDDAIGAGDSVDDIVDNVALRDNIVKNYTQGWTALCDNDTGNVAY